MKRQDKITRLAAVGFNALEVSNMSNDLLDSTYAAAQPLFTQKSRELQLALARESKHSRAKREEIAQRQARAKADVTWLSQWKPLQPIVAPKDPVAQIHKDIRTATKRRDEMAERFRQTGDQAYARYAREATETINSLTEALREEVK